MNLRLIVKRPGRAFMGEEPAETGYWGFVRSQADYEGELATIEREFGQLAEQMTAAGYDAQVLPTFEWDEAQDLLKYQGLLREADANILLAIGYGARASMPIMAHLSRTLICFDKFKPDMYAGTLFNPAPYQDLKAKGNASNVFLVEGDWEKLRAVLRAVYALRSVANSRLVCVGTPVSWTGRGDRWARTSALFGYETIFYTFDEFVERVNQIAQTREAAIRAAVDDFVGDAKRVVEPTEEKLYHAGAYYLAMKDLIDENDADWISVNCLSELIRRTQATPCMGFAMLNDRGIVSTCEADMTEGPIQYVTARMAAKPSFFNDPTVNEAEGTLILAHCTSPTKMLGYEEAALAYEVRTHHESNMGATPKPDFAPGTVTIAGLDFEGRNLLIVRGDVVGSPDLRICRSQVEVKVNDATAILEDWQGFHWTMVYGDYVHELQFICKMVGLKPIVHV